MNILIIGGGGFIGKNLANYFRKSEENNVYIIDRFTANIKNFFSLEELGWEKIIEQICTEKQWNIIDLAYATVPNTSFIDPIKDFSENLYLINATLKAIEALDIKQYIYFSSGGTVYGNSSSFLINETESNFPLSPYGITKMACERYVNMHHEIYGLKSVIVRPSNVYGSEQIPYRGQGLIINALALAFENKPIKIYGNGTIIRDYIYIEDLCSAIAAILNSNNTGKIYNIGSSIGYNILQIVDIINNVISPEGYVLNTQNLPMRPFDVKTNILDCSKIKNDTGWDTKVEIERGIKLTWEWVKNYLHNSKL
jgi:UDP-glucose 4-epimerase